MVEIRARINGEKTGSGFLLFTENSMEFHEDFKFGGNLPIEIAAEEISSVSFREISERDGVRTFG